MKKIIFLITVLLMSTNAFALDYSQYCSTEKVKTNFTGSLASLTGLNFLSRNLIEHEMTKAIKEETGSKFKIDLVNFFGKNISEGEFKSIKGEGKDLKINDYYISSASFSSLCDYNHVDYENNKLLFKENLVLNFEAKMTQDDLNKYLASSQYQKMLNKLNSDKTLSKLFKIEDGKIQISDDKLKFNYKVTPLPNNNISLLNNFLKTLNLSYSANLRVKDNKIELCDFDLNSLKISQNYLLPLLNMANPTVFKIKVDKEKDATLDVQNVKIANSSILFNGVVFVAKD